MTTLKGEVALVTGAAGRGIGQAVARRLAAGGARVVVTDVHARRTADVTAAMSAEYGTDAVLGLAMDAGDRAAIDTVLDQVDDRYGPVTILVNNAAINVMGGIIGYDPEAWDETVRVNLSGPWYLAQQVFTRLQRAGRGGCVVNISSYAPDVGGGGLETPYAVTKGGLNTLTRCLAHEGGPLGIRANTVSLGIVRGTKFVDDHPELLERADAIGPLGDLPTVAEIAELVAYLCAPPAAHITGETLNVAAGAYMRT